MKARTNPITCLVALACLAAAGPAAADATRTWHYMTTGNGHGFQIFDRQQGRITSLLEHPYRYVAPGDDARTWGVGRRDLAHDIYFGVRVGTDATWLHGSWGHIGYEQQTHIIQASTTHAGLHLDTYYFAPWGYAGNGMLMIVSARNDTAGDLDVQLFAKPNLKLGSGRVDPDDLGEEIAWHAGATPPHGVETGPGGGHAIYVPVGGVDHAACGSDSELYDRVLTSGDIGSTSSSSGNSRVLVLERDVHLAPGESAWWGVAVLFVNDDPNHPRAHLFRDHRSVDDILALWSTFEAGAGAQTLHDEALAEFEAWRADAAPAGLSAEEQAIWRQSEAVLRMGQVHERPGENYGMILASLPNGEWHTGWVRDAMYAVVALAMTGHPEEARLGLEFFLGADAGFFSDSIYLDMDYLVSSCRYFGNGLEEGDFNQDGPNVETDGWGLVLWAARAVLHESCGIDWLDQTTWRGETVFEALHRVAQQIETYSQSNLPRPDASIWEVHWNYRQVFGYTAAAQIRGLFDFAAIADVYGRSDLGDHYRQVASDWLAAASTALVHHPTQSFASHMGVAGDEVHVDGSVVGFLDWQLVGPSDSLYEGTLNQFSKLVTAFGGYRRLEEQLSLTGGGSAGTYDLSEWILLDLRIGDCWRRFGNSARADELLDKVTEHAVVNDNLIPELYDKDNGFYTGVVPMVGYGAGAWMMSQLRKHGHLEPLPGDGLGHCSACSPDPCTGDHEECVEDGQGGYLCRCEEGTHRDGGVCVPDTPCEPNPCTTVHRTVCIEEGPDDYRCECDPGWHDEAGTCVEDTPCSPNPCTEAHRTRCEVVDQDYLCHCDPGWHDEGGSCVEDTVCDPDTTCSGHGSCTGDGLECACDAGYTGDHCDQCADGYHPDGLDCVADTPCDPNPCTTVHKTRCVEDNGGYLCLCDDGYQDEDGDGTCLADCATAALSCGEHGHCEIVAGEAGCVCDTGYTGDDCTQCADGYHEEDGACVPDGGGPDGGTDGGTGQDFNDGAATLCAPGSARPGGWPFLLALLAGLLAFRRRS